MSKKYHLSRIFRPETGNTLILPIDHGISYGNLKGLEDPQQVLKELITDEVDAVLLSDGISNHTEDMFYGRGTPARIQVGDVVYIGNGHIHQDLYTDVETAVRKGYDAIKLIMYWDRPANEQMNTVQIISEVVKDAQKWDMPVLVEPLTFEPIEEEEKRIKVLSDGARVAYELGADILKLPHPGNKDALSEWVGKFNVPIILLGGSVNGEIDHVINQVEEAVTLGAKGVAIGRNLWQRPREEGKQLLVAFAEVIHKQQVVMK